MLEIGWRKSPRSSPNERHFGIIFRLRVPEIPVDMSLVPRNYRSSTESTAPVADSPSSKCAWPSGWASWLFIPSSTTTACSPCSAREPASATSATCRPWPRPTPPPTIWTPGPPAPHRHHRLGASRSPAPTCRGGGTYTALGTVPASGVPYYPAYGIAAHVATLANW